MKHYQLPIVTLGCLLSLANYGTHQKFNNLTSEEKKSFLHVWKELLPQEGNGDVMSAQTLLAATKKATPAQQKKSVSLIRSSIQQQREVTQLAMQVSKHTSYICGCSIIGTGITYAGYKQLSPTLLGVGASILGGTSVYIYQHLPRLCMRAARIEKQKNELHTNWQHFINDNNTTLEQLTR